LRGLYGLGEVIRKVVEVPKSPSIKGFRSDGHGEVSNTNIDHKPYFQKPSPRDTKLTPYWLPYIRWRAHLQTKKGKVRRRTRGR
jgi:hypothetical protein